MTAKDIGNALKGLVFLGIIAFLAIQCVAARHAPPDPALASAPASR